jgi:UDP-N-acetylglucosamine diphosphorylase/glucosamine-1-phosphate N-acetyltransferase
MNYILFDGPNRTALLPFTYTRPVADIAWGIGSIRDSWERVLGFTTSTITEPYLSEVWPTVFFESNVFINAAYLPTPDLVNKVKGLNEGEGIFDGEAVVAFFADDSEEDINFERLKAIDTVGDFLSISNTWDIFSKNDLAIALDFDILTEDRDSEPIPESVQVIGQGQVFIEAGAQLQYCILNATNGPIFLGAHSEVMEGSLIRGPFALGSHAMVKMGAKIYGATTIGAKSKVGGELNNVVMFPFSNKGHEGFLGNAVIGSWCNLGADTNNSNLKNSYENVRLWDYAEERFAKTGLQFCGLMMGDHSKSAINTMFNTGTVVGVASNIFGAGFAKNFIPSFSWGGIQNSSIHSFEKAVATAKIMMERKGEILSESDQMILEEVYKQSQKWRKE